MPRSGERRRDREKEREGRRLQAASNAAEVACTPSPPKIPIPLVSPPRGEERIPFLRGGTRPKTGDRLLARPRLGGKLYALDPTPFPIFLSRSRCEPANPPLVYDHRRSDRCRYLVFSFRDEEDRGFNATAYTYLEI